MAESEPLRSKWREWLADLFSGDESDEDSSSTFRALLSEAAERDLLSEAAINIINGALQVSQIQARDIMVPRANITYLHIDERPSEFLAKLIDSGHSRFPVVGDDMDDIHGILHAKDLLPLVLRDDEDDFEIRDVIRSATTVPESQPVYGLLQQFRSTRTHMAIVVNEYGNVSGVVTIEDVLEQIVGEIEDEHDVEDDEDLISELDARTYSIKANTPLEVFDDRFGTAFTTQEFDTVGGLVVKAFGEVPSQGDETTIGKMSFKVLTADSRRIRRVQMTCL